MTLSLKHLAYVVSAADLGSITRASEALEVSPPAISAAQSTMREPATTPVGAAPPDAVGGSPCIRPVASGRVSSQATYQWAEAA